jgi:hypothetical protein
LSAFDESRQIRDAGGKFAGTTYAAADNEITFLEDTDAFAPSVTTSMSDPKLNEALSQGREVKGSVSSSMTVHCMA